MFVTDDIAKLQRTVSAYDVPMFVVERARPGGEFRYLCLNDSLAMLTGLTSLGVMGVRPRDVLERDEAAAVEAHYATCAETAAVLHYRQKLHIAGRLTDWSTTLHPVKMRGTRLRIVGTAVPHALNRASSALDDVAFLSRASRMQLGKIAHFLEMLETRRDLPPELYEGAAIVTGLCHGIEQVLDDIGRAGRRCTAAQGMADLADL